MPVPVPVVYLWPLQMAAGLRGICAQNAVSSCYDVIS